MSSVKNLSTGELIEQLEIETRRSHYDYNMDKWPKRFDLGTLQMEVIHRLERAEHLIKEKNTKPWPYSADLIPRNGNTSGTPW